MSTAAKTQLDQIAQEIATCTKCNLCKTRTNTVPGEGSPTARLMFIGEAPGYHEDQQGRPFVGNSGELLNKLLRAIKLPREDVFIANVIKCRPPNNQDPTEEQIAACKPYLDRQIAAINPRVVVTLGRFSMRRWWPGQLISKIHGQPRKDGARIILPMFHPAAALRDTDRTLRMFKEDGLTIPTLLEEAEELARTELWGFVAEEPDPAQPVLGQTATALRPAIAETSARTVYPTPEVTALPAEPTVEQTAPLTQEMPGQPIEAAPTEVTAAKRTRRPKAEAPADGSVEETPRVPSRPRKKRTTGEAEQLTMF